MRIISLSFLKFTLSFVPATIILILASAYKPTAPQYTSDMVDFVCPIDGKRFKSEVCMSRTSFGKHRDFSEYGAIGNYYETIIHQCPGCHFCSFQFDFDTTYTSGDKAAIQAVVASYSGSKIDQALENEVAAKIWQSIHRHEDRAPDAYLWASYILRDSKKKVEARKSYQVKAADAFAANHTFEADSSGQREKCAIRYLSGELYRRASLFEKSIAYFDSAMAVPVRSSGIDIWIKEQRALAIAKDDQNDI